MQKRAITDLNAPNDSRDIPFQSQKFMQDSPFRRFSASFSIKYDVADPILQDNEKMNFSISETFCLICLKLFRLLELGKGILLHFKFCCYDNQDQNYLLLKNKRSIV